MRWFASSGVYRIGAREQALPARAPGQHRGRVHLGRMEGGRFEWSVTEDLALGPTRPSDLARALDALFRGFAPRYAAFLRRYATPIRTSLVVSDYHRRKGLDLQAVERWLAPHLGYDPADA